MTKLIVQVTIHLTITHYIRKRLFPVTRFLGFNFAEEIYLGHSTFTVEY